MWEGGREDGLGREGGNEGDSARNSDSEGGTRSLRPHGMERKGPEAIGGREMLD